eukprot:TRINITY_DN13841_c0_g1_i1.p1 TRINITY_DN13841_c0_g1~~TRINITY_DN13841_c0_g1_i1.p1  ORF type:complete len:323 (+),score=36.12 TRINITY_DN13841_c0_g1_i1:152-1120(+)
MLLDLEPLLYFCGWSKKVPWNYAQATTPAAEQCHTVVQFAGENYFDKLPYELLLHIAQFLTSKQICKLATVSKRWASLSRDQQLWKRLCTVELGFTFLYDHQTECNYIGANWKKIFQSLQSGPDAQPSYHDASRKVLGCIHYQRSCKIKPTCCGKWSPCRICHDQQTDDHVMDRFATQEMMCMICKTIQPVAAACQSEACRGKKLARYYCSICKLWEDNERKDIYHCFHCGFCRLGKESEFYHCFQCSMCISVTVRNIHRCKPGQTKGQCPVCNKLGPMWNGLAPILFLPCGDAVHVRCYQHLLANDLPCPICKARVDVEVE